MPILGSWDLWRIILSSQQQQECRDGRFVWYWNTSTTIQGIDLKTCADIPQRKNPATFGNSMASLFCGCEVDIFCCVFNAKTACIGMKCSIDMHGVHRMMMIGHPFFRATPAGQRFPWTIISTDIPDRRWSIPAKYHFPVAWNGSCLLWWLTDTEIVSFGSTIASLMS